MITSSTVFTGLAGLVLILAYRAYAWHKSEPQFPGPRPDPLIGNFRHFPGTYLYRTFTEWGRRYGPITYTNIFGYRIIIINTHEAAVDLLDKKAAIYSCRPPQRMAVDLCGLGWSTVFLPYGSLLKKHRRYIAQAFHPRTVQKDYGPLLQRKTHEFANCLLEKPDDFRHHVERLIGQSLQMITYGACRDGDVDFVKLGMDSMKIVNSIFEGYAVDVISWLKYVPAWFPFAQFQRDAKIWRGVIESSRQVPFQMVKRKAAAGEWQPRSFVSSLLEENNGVEADEADIISGIAATLYAGTRVKSLPLRYDDYGRLTLCAKRWCCYQGGSENTVATLLTFILAMTLYPDVQKQAQAEIDRVLGNRLPTAEDEAQLPYLSAVLTETLRWHPAASIGGTHKVTEDDVYNGVRIRSGTFIFVNSWGIMHDERHFPDPFTFNPDRWISPTPGVEKTTGAVPDPWAVIFGYGRRICPAIQIARPAIWLAMVMLLSSFEIRPKLDPVTNKPIIPEAKWSGLDLRYVEV